MEKAITTLNAIKESIIEAYARKTGLSRNKISQLMTDETWLPAKKALNLGFIDGILFSEEDEMNAEVEDSWQSYSSKAMGRTILNRIIGTKHCDPVTDAAHAKTADQSAVLDVKDTAEEPAKAQEEPAEVAETDALPVIGMDGKTKDGSMPYLILVRQLEFLGR